MLLVHQKDTRTVKRRCKNKSNGEIFNMIPANKIKEISSKIHTNYGDSDRLPPVKPILIVLLIVGMLYVAVCYF